MDTLALNNALTEKLSAASYSTEKSAITKMADFLVLLIQWNQTYNLTSISDPERMITHHILDSLAITDFLHGNRLLDVGSGAGFPGIPLAITQPDRHFTLLDSNGKKARFLLHVIQTLKIPNVTVEQARVEQYEAAPFDTIMSRAFTSIKNFVDLTQHLIAIDGIFLAMKGDYPTAELTEFEKKTRNRLKTVHTLNIPGLNAKRHVVVIPA